MQSAVISTLQGSDEEDPLGEHETTLQLEKFFVAKKVDPVTVAAALNQQTIHLEGRLLIGVQACSFTNSAICLLSSTSPIR